MKLSDIEGNVIYGGKDDTINLLEKIAEAISKGGILIDDVKVDNFSKVIEKVGRDIIKVDQEWKKISFCYKFENRSEAKGAKEYQRFEVNIRLKNKRDYQEIYSGSMNVSSEYLERLDNVFRSGETINFDGKKFRIIELNYLAI